MRKTDFFNLLLLIKFLSGKGSMETFEIVFVIMYIVCTNFQLYANYSEV